MADSNANRAPDSEVARIVRRTARRLRQTRDFRHEELQELEQELWQRFYQANSRFDGSRASWSRFARMILRCAAVSILRHARAHRRDRRSVLCSLDAEIGDDTWEGTPTSMEEYLVSAGLLEGGDGSEWADLSIDLGRALAGAPSELQELARLLPDHTLVEAARILGVPRTTLHDRRRRLGEFLDRRGVGPSADVSRRDRVPNVKRADGAEEEE